MRVHVAIPMRDKPTGHMMMSILGMANGLPEHSFNIDMGVGVSDLAKARCVFVQKAREAKADKLLFVDDDAAFAPNHVKMLLEANADVTCCVVRRKTLDVRHVGYLLEDMGRKAEREGPLVGMAAVGMHLTAIDMSFVEKMLASWDEKEWFAHHEGVKEKVPALFQFKMGVNAAGDYMWMAEDEHFCLQVLNAGGKIRMHTEVQVGHVGTLVYA